MHPVPSTGRFQLPPAASMFDRIFSMQRFSHSHCHKYLNLCDHTARSMLYCFFSLSAACSVLQNKPMLLSSPNLSVHNYTQSSQPPSESSSLLFTLLLYPPRHLSSMIAMYVYLESRCRIAWWSAKSLFYPETQVLDSSCKHYVVSSRNCVMLLYVHLTLCFITR